MQTSSRKPLQNAKSASASSATGDGCALLFLILYTLVGLAVLTLTFILPLLQIARARSWPAVPCVIMASTAKKMRGDESSYQFQVRYRYKFAGKNYVGSQYFFAAQNTGTRSPAQELTEKYPVGATSVCFVDPASPRRAVLEPGITAETFLGLLPLIFVLVGGYFLCQLTRRKQDTMSTQVPQLAQK